MAGARVRGRGPAAQPSPTPAIPLNEAGFRRRNQILDGGERGYHCRLTDAGAAALREELRTGWEGKMPRPARPGSRRLRTLLAVGVAMAGLSAAPASAETRSYVMTMFWHALETTEEDCPGGINPKIEEQHEKDLVLLGYSPEEAAALIKNGYFNENAPRGWENDKLGHIMLERGRIQGKPVNAFMHPATTIDPNLITKVGRFAHGFNLDRKDVAPGNFANPDTGEKGIDHQLARVFGCFENMRGNMKDGSAFWLYKWSALKETMPAWTISVTGDDLSKDGPVQVRVGSAMEAVKFNGNGKGRHNMTYRQEQDERFAKNAYPGEIKNGRIRITKPGDLYMEQDPLLFPIFTMKQFSMDLQINADSTVQGFIGGYQPIIEIYFAIAAPSLPSETLYAIDFPGLYHTLRKNADFDFDKKTGFNRSISSAYHIIAVPAHVVPVTSDRRTAGN